MFTSKMFPVVYCDMLPSSGQHVLLHKHDTNQKQPKVPELYRYLQIIEWVFKIKTTTYVCNLQFQSGNAFFILMQHKMHVQHEILLLLDQT